jgi:hypothetical protein
MKVFCDNGGLSAETKAILVDTVAPLLISKGIITQRPQALHVVPISIHTLHIEFWELTYE